MHNFSYHKTNTTGYRKHFTIISQDGETFYHYAHTYSLAYIHTEKMKKNSTFGINIGEEFYTARVVKFSREDQFNYELSGEGLESFADREYDEHESTRMGVAFNHFLYKYEDSQDYATMVSPDPSHLPVYGTLVDRSLAKPQLWKHMG